MTLGIHGVILASFSTAIEEIASFSLEPSPKFSNNLISLFIIQVNIIHPYLYYIILIIVISRILCLKRSFPFSFNHYYIRTIAESSSLSST